MDYNGERKFKAMKDYALSMMPSSVESVWGMDG
jgi:hypothetical protein